MQGTTFTFLIPIIAILSLPQWKCPTDEQIIANRLGNSTFSTEVTPAEYDEVWMVRMREVQGSIIMGSFFEMIIGFSGIMGMLLKFITPLAIVPFISLIGLSLFKEATAFAEKDWLVATM